MCQSDFGPNSVELCPPILPADESCEQFPVPFSANAAVVNVVDCFDGIDCIDFIVFLPFIGGGGGGFDNLGGSESSIVG
ncbi:hypothetical protein DERP_006139 [Dermatophagoides pteronyssinus]|uniref:Uncharacterized protein n=1 Tax=Dermatophagoides pteronyssinus TaxID=6956 RepID=A0ABQ8JSY2_DERPT|nr:hypothetical protein DERP_006139 [Dermatophagoides pteronyssinus]